MDVLSNPMNISETKIYGMDISIDIFQYLTQKISEHSSNNRTTNFCYFYYFWDYGKRNLKFYGLFS